MRANRASTSLGRLRIDWRAGGALAPLLEEALAALRPHFEGQPPRPAIPALSLDFDPASERPPFHAALGADRAGDETDWAIAPAAQIAIWDLLAAFPNATHYTALAIRTCAFPGLESPGPIDSIRFDSAPRHVPPGPARCGGLVQDVIAPHTRCTTVFVTLTFDEPEGADFDRRIDGGSRLTVAPAGFGIDATAALTDFLRDLRPAMAGFAETILLPVTLAASGRQLSLCLAVDELSRVAQAIDCICRHAAPGPDRPMLADRLFDVRRSFGP